MLAERLNNPEIQAILDEKEKELEEIERQHFACESYKAQELAKLAEIKRLGGLRQYEDFTEEKIKNKAILKELSNFPKGNYYLYGPAGCGKTHAGVAIIRKMPQARLVRMSQISREYREDMSAENEDYIINKYSKMLLLLDDLGSEKMTEFLQNIFFEIIDNRWSNKIEGLIITSNLNIKQLATIIGDRTASRIIGLVGKNNFINLSGKDYRFEL